MEIKLRAFNEGEMIYPSTDGHGTLTSGWILSNYTNIMMWTGLFDKNKKEIYEGDIVQFYDGMIFTIKYYPTKCAFGLDSPFKHMDFMAALYDSKMTDVYTDKIEVIGNIYENKKELDGIVSALTDRLSETNPDKQ